MIPRSWTIDVHLYVGDDGYSMVVRSPRASCKYGPYRDWETLMDQVGNAVQVQLLDSERASLCESLGEGEQW